MSSALPPPDLRRTWLFGSGAEAAAHARGEDHALVAGLWVEVPAYRNALRLIERAERLGRAS